MTISIHAPVKGATFRWLCFWVLRVISIHAPVKGATEAIPLTRPCTNYFNPRSREGSDLAKASLSPQLSSISIHAPVKGATLK